MPTTVFTPAATSKMRPLRRASVPSAPLSIRRSAREDGTLQAIAIAGGPESSEPALTAPCGVCRQVMMEFCDPEEFRIILGAGTGEKQVYLLKELLPLSFGPDNLKGKEKYS